MSTTNVLLMSTTTMVYNSCGNLRNKTTPETQTFTPTNKFAQSNNNSKTTFDKVNINLWIFEKFFK